MDVHTKKRIQGLHPHVREEVVKIIKACDLALQGRAKIRITQGLRTAEEQDKLYALGRTLPGKRVTRARGGESIHNYGFAVDICLIIDGKMASWDTLKDWDNDTVSDWYECVKIFSMYGWEWGGLWKSFKDLSHFEKKGFNNWRKLMRMPKDTENYVIIGNSSNT